MLPERVVHAQTGAPGTARFSTVLEPDFAGDMAGQWLHVDFDDGLRCWCPVVALLPEGAS